MFFHLLSFAATVLRRNHGEEVTLPSLESERTHVHLAGKISTFTAENSAADLSCSFSETLRLISRRQPIFFNTPFRHCVKKTSSASDLSMDGEQPLVECAGSVSGHLISRGR